jgi:hypothetical protein
MKSTPVADIIDHSFLPDLVKNCLGCLLSFALSADLLPFGNIKCWALYLIVQLGSLYDQYSGRVLIYRGFSASP